MSGHGSSGGVFGSGHVEASCDALHITTALASPNSDVTLTLGEVLTVRLQTGPATVAVCITRDGTIAGSLAFGDVQRLIRCMHDGHAYTAKVITIQGARRVVEVTHA
jgi:hypothetical protein